MEPLLEVKDLNIRLGEINVVEGVSFDVEKGEVVTIIGPNGAGKTTLIRAIMGLVPYSGSVRFLREPIQKHLKQLGYVPQRFDFDKTFPITVGEFLNLEKGLVTSGDVTRICQELEISALKNQTLGTLSGGQLQRVLIARALLQHPQLLIMDEPTAGVDIGGVKSFYEIVRHLNETHEIAVILISHEINMVYSLASKVICLNKQMFCSGSPKTAITKKILDKLYSKNVGPKKHTHIH